MPPKAPSKKRAHSASSAPELTKKLSASKRRKSTAKPLPRHGPADHSDDEVEERSDEPEHPHGDDDDDDEKEADDGVAASSVTEDRKFQLVLAELKGLKQSQAVIEKNQAAIESKLEELIADNKTISISKAKQTHWDYLCSRLNIADAHVKLVPEPAPKKIPAFKWTSAQEVAHYGRAIKYLTPLLQLDAKPELHLRLTAQREMLERDADATLDMKLKGTTDLMITTSKLAIEGCRVIFELKAKYGKRKPLEKEFRACVIQMRFQMVLAAWRALEPIMGVLTDLGKNWSLFWFSKRADSTIVLNKADVDDAPTAIYRIRKFLGLVVPAAAPLASSSSSSSGPSGGDGAGGGGGSPGTAIKPSFFLPSASGAASSSAPAGAGGQQDAAHTVGPDDPLSQAIKLEYPICVPEDIVRMNDLVDEMTPNEREQYELYVLTKMLSLQPAFWGANISIPPPFTTRCESPPPADSPPIEV